MRSIVILPLMLTACTTASDGVHEPSASSSTAVVRNAPVATYTTHKSLAAIEKCLTDSLSKLDDITSVNTGDVTTLVYGKRTEPSMLIELAPPRVSVTTNFAPGTRELVEACI
jgi:hypothetical protein